MHRRLLAAAAALTAAACGMWPGSLPEQPTPIPTFTPAVAAPGAEQQPALGGKPVGDMLVWIFSEPNPPRRGSTVLEVLITDQGGEAAADAAVSFDIDMTNMSHGKNVTLASSLGQGRYAGEVFFLMPGPWRVIVGIDRGGQVSAVRFDFMVNW